LSFSDDQPIKRIPMVKLQLSLTQCSRE